MVRQDAHEILIVLRKIGGAMSGLHFNYCVGQGLRFFRLYRSTFNSLNQLGKNLNVALFYVRCSLLEI